MNQDTTFLEVDIIAFQLQGLCDTVPQSMINLCQNVKPHRRSLFAMCNKLREAFARQAGRRAWAHARGCAFGFGFAFDLALEPRDGLDPVRSA